MAPPPEPPVDPPAQPDPPPPEAPPTSPPAPAENPTTMNSRLGPSAEAQAKPSAPGPVEPASIAASIVPKRQKEAAASAGMGQATPPEGDPVVSNDD